MRRSALALLVPVLLAACSSSAARVPVLATQEDARALVGAWAGEYASSVTGRSGSILFTLRAEGDTARGDVVMTARGTNQPYGPARGGGEESLTGARSSQVLEITFVRIDGSRVSGRLEPYRDPECGCTLLTTFAGTLHGDSIEGTFITRGLPGGGMPTGEWKVSRTR